jgi:hypothetical protein
VPLGEQFDHGFKVADQEHEWLCPDHRVILHLWIDDPTISYERRGRRAAPTMDEVGLVEFDKLMDLADRSGRRSPTIVSAHGNRFADTGGFCGVNLLRWQNRI